MEENGIYGIYQSVRVYHAHNSAETALVRIHNAIAESIDSRRSVLLVLLDLSAAFDTINHNTLLRRLSGHGLSGVTSRIDTAALLLQHALHAGYSSMCQE